MQIELLTIRIYPQALLTEALVEGRDTSAMFRDSGPQGAGAISIVDLPAPVRTLSAIVF